MELWRILVITMLLEFSGGKNVEDVLFSNSWAVEVRGGSSVADWIAKSHGFINKGQVGSLNNIYHFVHVLSPTRTKRSVDSFHPKHFALKMEVHVGYVEQQVVKQRSKRGHIYTYSHPSGTQWEKQWYLHRSNGHNMNVERVWEQNIIGRGAVVSILDDGIEYTHPDLRKNYDPLASYDFNDHDDDPIPRYDPTNENKHGTRCAGEVAAMKGGSCGMGVAYGSKVGGVRMLDGDVTDVVEASSLSLKPQHIDIYSSSWGPNDDGKTVDGPGKLASKAFIDGVTYGRNGLGSIFVWAAGNGGRYGDSCNCDGYAVSPFTISIGSASEHDKRPWYLEKCSSTLASTYSSGGVTEKQIVTTDIHKICTERHTGTSASAPLAAGMMALALEANSNLTWRDMQYLMVYSSNPKYPHDGEWKSNGAGLKVSHWYGFGILDGSTLVNLARNWVSVPKQKNCTYNATTQFVGREVATSNSHLVINIQVGNCNLAYLEHVQAVTTLRVNAGARKDISITLTSPAGTTSTLLPNRQHDRHKDGLHSWPFMTVHSWGEQPLGKWTFGIKVLDDGEVVLESLQLILYGTESVPLSVHAIPNQCHPECLNTCAREGPKYCDVCKNYRRADTLECIESCPRSMYVNDHTCRSCPPFCAKCDNGHSCIECHSHTFRLADGSCSEHCVEGTFPAPNKSCLVCHQSCKTCDGPFDTSCTSCHSQFTLHKNACLIRDPTSCPIGQYFDHRAHECRSCHKSCASCTNKESTSCKTCFGRAAVDEEGRCVDTRQLRSCFSGQYFDGDKSECATCPPHCSSCLNNSTCTLCPPGVYLTEHGNCVESCNGEICLGVHCNEACLTCFGTESFQCNSCPDNLYLANNSCVQQCPPNYFTYEQSCRSCHKSCESCKGPSESDCVTCPKRRLWSNYSCVSHCPEGTYNNSSMCSQCIKDCIDCSTSDSCNKCRNGYYLLDTASCVTLCPPGFVAHYSSRVCQSCPSNCAVCYSDSTCDICQPGYVYYAPSGSCLLNCPLGYYASTSNTCTSCELPCSTCTGSALNCSSCSRGLALDTAAQVCRDCCNPDRAVTQCCDCDANAKFCQWLNSTRTLNNWILPTKDANTTHIIIGFFIGFLVVLICVLIVVVFVRHYFPTKKYQMVPKDEVSASETCSDTDLFVVKSVS